MSTSKEMIRSWLKNGLAVGASHVMVVCDQFDWEDYPKFIMPGQDAYQEYYSVHGNNMQSVMEVYKLNMDWNAQLDEHRALHF